MLGEVARNGTITSRRHGSFPLAKIEHHFVRVFLGSPKFCLTGGDELKEWHRAHRWPSELMIS
jgi:hypothetical protein